MSIQNITGAFLHAEMFLQDTISQAREAARELPLHLLTLLVKMLLQKYKEMGERQWQHKNFRNCITGHLIV